MINFPYALLEKHLSRYFPRREPRLEAVFLVIIEKRYIKLLGLSNFIYLLVGNTDGRTRTGKPLGTAF